MKKTIKSKKQLQKLINQLQIKDQNQQLHNILNCSNCTVYAEIGTAITYYIYSNCFGSIEKIDIFTD